MDARSRMSSQRPSGLDHDPSHALHRHRWIASLEEHMLSSERFVLHMGAKDVMS